jgi:putative restriction endonuclease
LNNKSRVTRERVFFRRAVLSAYEYRCCISGQTLPDMLIASHIKPFNICRSSGDRTTPENGLCLNVFYDKAFDQGYITIDPSLTIWVSPRVRDFPDAFTEQWLIDLQGSSIELPGRFRPRREFLEYHNEKIFKG